VTWLALVVLVSRATIFLSYLRLQVRAPLSIGGV